MIARVWRGVTRETDAEEYGRYIVETGFAAYGTTPGNRGAWLMRRDSHRTGVLLPGGRALPHREGGHPSTISATLPITQPGTYHWKGALTCNTNGMGGVTSVESKTRASVEARRPRSR